MRQIRPNALSRCSRFRRSSDECRACLDTEISPPSSAVVVRSRLRMPVPLYWSRLLCSLFRRNAYCDVSTGRTGRQNHKQVHPTSHTARPLNRNAALLNEKQSSNHPYPITPHYYLSEMALERDVQVLVTQHDFDLALSQLKPSVTESEMQHYAKVQRLFSSDATNRTHTDAE